MEILLPTIPIKSPSDTYITRIISHKDEYGTNPNTPREDPILGSLEYIIT